MGGGRANKGGARVAEKIELQHYREIFIVSVSCPTPVKFQMLGFLMSILLDFQ